MTFDILRPFMDILQLTGLTEIMWHAGGFAMAAAVGVLAYRLLRSDNSL